MTDLFGQEKMLALSWKQPFGSAMLVGKDETRVWDTSYRGLVLICTSKMPYDEDTARRICGDHQFERLCQAVKPVEETLDLDGYAIAVGTIIGSRLMQPADEDKTFVQYRIPWREYRRGKDGVVRRYDKSLFVHSYENVRRIVPIPWKGCQGWKAVPEEIKKQIQYV